MVQRSPNFGTTVESSDRSGPSDSRRRSICLFLVDSIGPVAQKCAGAAGWGSGRRVGGAGRRGWGVEQKLLVAMRRYWAVVARLRCPSSSWMVRTSVPPSSKCTAKACRLCF